MGEIAEMMLDGTLCAGCGDFLGEDAGYACYCPGCQPKPRTKAKPPQTQQWREERTIPCPECGKKFARKWSMRQHRNMKHDAPRQRAGALAKKQAAEPTKGDGNMYRVTAKNTETTVASAGEAIATAELYEEQIGPAKIEVFDVPGEWSESSKEELVASLSPKESSDSEGGAA